MDYIHVVSQHTILTVRLFCVCRHRHYSPSRLRDIWLVEAYCCRPHRCHLVAHRLSTHPLYKRRSRPPELLEVSHSRPHRNLLRGAHSVRHGHSQVSPVIVLNGVKRVVWIGIFESKAFQSPLRVDQWSELGCSLNLFIMQTRFCR